MTLAAREVLVLVEESAYGTPILTAGAVDYTLATTYVVPLPSANAWNVDVHTMQKEIMFGGGLAVTGDVIQDQADCKGSLSTLGYPALFAFLCQAAITRVDGLGAPWATDQTVNDLASFAAYHAIVRYDGTVKRRKFIGGKMAGLNASCTRDDPALKVSCDIQFQKEIGTGFPTVVSDVTSSEFPLPTAANYPKQPYLFSHTAGNVKLGGSALTMYESINLKIANTLDPLWFESNYVSLLRALGRDTTVDLGLLFKSSPDVRAFYQTLATKECSVKWDNGAHTALIDLGNSNHLTKATWDLGLGKEYLQQVSVKNRWDYTANTDVAFTAT